MGDLIYYIIIIDVILIFIGLLIAYFIDRFHKNVDETVKLIHIMTQDIVVITKYIEEMNVILEEKSRKLDGIIGSIEENLEIKKKMEKRDD